MKRFVWLVPVFGLIACAEREKQVEATPSQPTTVQQSQTVEPVRAGKFTGIDVKKPFVAPGGAVATASASASAK